jgi:hypothetical protein
MKNIILLFIMFFIFSGCNRLLKEQRDIPDTIEWCVMSWANEAAESPDSPCTNYPEIQALDRYKAQKGQSVAQRIKGLEEQIESLRTQLAYATNLRTQLANSANQNSQLPTVRTGPNYYVLYRGERRTTRYDTESGCLTAKQQEEEITSRRCNEGGLGLLSCLAEFSCKKSYF